MKRKGVDVSTHNGAVDFAALKAAGVEFVLIRCGYGSDYLHQDDLRFEENVRKAEAAGLHWGAYLYSYATSTAMAKSEAQHALRLLAGRKPTYGVWYDVEDSSQAGTDLVSICETFCAAMEAAGLYTGIYSYLSWLTGPLSSSRLDRYDKWVAQWADACTYPKPYGIWQFTDSWAVGGKAFDGNWAYRDYPAIVQGMSAPGNQDPSEEKEEPELTDTQIRSIVRSELAAYFQDLAKLPPSEGWGEQAVAWAKETGLAAGDPDGNMRPHSPLTREEAFQLFKSQSNQK